MFHDTNMKAEFIFSLKINKITCAQLVKLVKNLMYQTHLINIEKNYLT